MTHVSRRNLIRVTALGAAVASGVVGQEQALAAKLSGKKAVVVGSGFGGAVAAFRLGQAGVQTTVLERGASQPDHAAWFEDSPVLGLEVGQPIERRAGVLAKHRGDGLNVLSGAGVGGGSLVGMSLSQPRKLEWDKVYGTNLPYEVMDQTYWPRARQNLTGSVDQNYLAWAAATGNVTIQALHEVTEIHAAGSGFRLVCQQINDAGETLATKEFQADFLFLAAGAVYTNSLLVTARAKGWLPNLRSSVGKGFGNNGDFLVARLNSRSAGSPERVIDSANPFALAAIAAAPAAVPGWEGNATAHLVTSMAPERGEVRYDAATDTGKVFWPYGAMETKGEKAGRDLVTRQWWQDAGSKGHLLADLPAFDRSVGHGLGSDSTWSPLGGMVMGESTDFSGKSLDYSNLYCVDGSVLPGTACLANPSLTITANAERCLDDFVAQHA
jgi:cholesterol oxidase